MPFLERVMAERYGLDHSKTHLLYSRDRTGMAIRASIQCLILLVALCACGKSQLEFRKDLSELGVEYSRDEFLKRIEDGDLLVVGLFLKSGMNPDVLVNSHTPLIAAANQPQIVRLLLEYGANPNIENEYELTPLGEAANKGNVNSAKVLMAAGAEVNPSPKNGWTPLLRAVAYGNSIDVTVLLANAGADVSAKTPWGNTAYGEALRNRNGKLVKLLEELGAKESYSRTLNDR